MARTTSPLTFGQAKRALSKHGFTLARQKGSHRIFVRSNPPSRVTLAGKDNKDIAKGTVNSIKKQTGLPLACLMGDCQCN